MTILNIRHTGIVVKDLDKALDFYCNILGFKEIDRGNLTKEEANSLIYTLKSSLEWVKLSINNTILELYKINDVDIVYTGMNHFALTVNNIDQWYCKLINIPSIVYGEPKRSKEGKAKIMFVRDIDWNLIEFVEELPAS